MSEIRVGCAVLAVRDGRILLGKRGKAPFYGKWVIPGGGVNRFESFAETAVRELAEETGLEISVREIATVKEIISPPHEHRVIVYVSADVVGGGRASRLRYSRGRLLRQGTVGRNGQGKPVDTNGRSDVERTGLATGTKQSAQCCGIAWGAGEVWRDWIDRSLIPSNCRMPWRAPARGSRSVPPAKQSETGRSLK